MLSFTVLPGLEVIDHLGRLADVQLLGAAAELVVAFVFKIQIETIGDGVEGTKLTASCGSLVAVPLAVGVILRLSLLMATNLTNPTILPIADVPGVAVAGSGGYSLLHEGDFRLFVQTGDLPLKPPGIGEQGLVKFSRDVDRHALALVIL
jgi:hypothetical protein